MKYGETVKAIQVNKACWRFLVDGAILTPSIFEIYKEMLTQSELAKIKFEEVSVLYLGYNIIQYRDELLGEDHERNVFYLSNGNSVHN